MSLDEEEELRELRLLRDRIVQAGYDLTFSLLHDAFTLQAKYAKPTNLITLKD